MQLASVSLKPSSCYLQVDTRIKKTKEVDADLDTDAMKRNFIFLVSCLCPHVFFTLASVYALASLV